MASWRTTLLGLLMILGAVATAGQALVDSDPATEPNWGVTWIAVAGGVGLMTARDQKAHDEGK